MNRIKVIIEEQGIIQAWLSHQLVKFSNIVNGYLQNRNQPSSEVIYRIKDILRVEVKNILISSK